MKLTTTEVYVKQILPLILLTTVSIIIWQAGPHLTVANMQPLLLPQNRFYIISILFLGWLIKFLFFDTAAHTHIAASLEDLKKLQTLRGRFQGAMQFLKKTSISKYGKNISLSQLPWFLLIGTANSGKTTLLANSNINFILSKQFKTEDLKNISASQHCDWWTTRDLVLLDVPSTYITSRSKQPKTSLSLWDHLLDLIKKNRSHQSLSGIIVALQLPELMKKHNPQQRKQILNELKQRILQLREKFGSHLPVYITITKCDLLPGFSEFFSDSGSDELAQAWGVTLPRLKENEKIHDVFSHRFNALIKRLNTQLIWRLHQERHPNIRSYIKDFPLQLERLKESIAHFLKALMTPDLCLHGVYLTSATQPVSEEQNTSTTLMHSAQHQALQLTRLPSTPSRSYFIRQLLLQGLSGTSQDHSQPILQPKEIWQRRAIYAASAAAVILAAILLGRDFQSSVQQVNSLQAELAEYQLYVQKSHQQDKHLAKALPMLNGLSEAATASHHSLSYLMNALSFYSNKSQKTVQIVYAQALQTIVLPEIKTLLEKNLLNTNDKNAGRSYMALKAYLMLGDAQHMDTVFVINTIKQLMANTLNPQAADQLADHIAVAFSSVWKPMQLNNNLIAQVRKQLSGLSAVDMGFAILKNLNTNNADSKLKLGTNIGAAPAFISKQAVNQIPSLYTANAFQSNLSRDINSVAAETLQGNWVLGNATNFAESTTVNTLTEQLRTLYISKYIDVWEILLANIQMSSPKNLSQLNLIVASLTSNTSPLLQLLQTIQQNTSFEPIIAASPKLQSLNILLASANNSQQNTLYRCLVTLRQLDFYLQTILHSPSVGNAAFEATKARMQDPGNDPISQLAILAEQSPEPLKAWLTALYSQSWKLLLQESMQHIATTWKNNVGSVYQTEFANRYPFNQNATQEVTLQQFTSFLGQKGTLSQFYQTYLKHFVNESGKKWQWRIIDNMMLPFSEVALEQIHKALKVQRAFFPNGDNQLFVQFSLEPVTVDVAIKDFMLNINGQEIPFQKQHNPRTLTWPGPNTTHATSIHATGQDNQPMNRIVQGDWGWFRLVTQATREVITPKQLNLNISVNGHAAKYVLHTQGSTNPFLPLNLTHFELPERLV